MAFSFSLRKARSTHCLWYLAERMETAAGADFARETGPGGI